MSLFCPKHLAITDKIQKEKAKMIWLDLWIRNRTETQEGWACTEGLDCESGGRLSRCLWVPWGSGTKSASCKTRHQKPGSVSEEAESISTDKRRLWLLPGPCLKVLVSLLEGNCKTWLMRGVGDGLEMERDESTNQKKSSSCCPLKKIPSNQLLRKIGSMIKSKPKWNASGNNFIDGSH